MDTFPNRLYRQLLLIILIGIEIAIIMARFYRIEAAVSVKFIYQKEDRIVQRALQIAIM